MVDGGRGRVAAEPPPVLDLSLHRTGAFVPLTALLLAPDAGPQVFETLADPADTERLADWYRHTPGSGDLEPHRVPDDTTRLQVAVLRSPRSVAVWRPLLRTLGVPVSM